ncbi:MAG: hypothetical protein IJM08_06840 [Firmicutes bacterium]|nr:hypothetical protein [Bacillota bacterium]
MKSISVSSQYAPLRVCADISFYLYVVSVLSLRISSTFWTERGVFGIVSNLVTPWLTQLLVFVLACLAVGFVAVRTENAALRFALSLIPGLVFLTSKPELGLIVPAASWAYYMIYITAGSFETYVDSYRRRLRIMLIVALLASGFLIVFHFASDDVYTTKLFGGEEFGLLFFVLSVVSLRGMRLVNGTPKKMRALDTAYVIAVPVILTACVLLFRLMVPVVSYIIKLLAHFVRWLLSVLRPDKPQPDFLEIVEEYINNAEQEILDLRVDPEADPSVEPMDGKNIRINIPPSFYYLLFVAAVTVVLVIIAVRLFANRKKGTGRFVFKSEDIDRIPPETEPVRRSEEPSSASNAGKIRRIYRSYLEHFRSLNMKLEPSDTSQDVLRYSGEFNQAAENGTMRDLYIAARYGDPAEVTAEQVAEAKRCLTAVKEM